MAGRRSYLPSGQVACRRRQARRCLVGEKGFWLLAGRSTQTMAALGGPSDRRRLPSSRAGLAGAFIPPGQPGRPGSVQFSHFSAPAFISRLRRPLRQGVQNFFNQSTSELVASPKRYHSRPGDGFRLRLRGVSGVGTVRAETLYAACHWHTPRPAWPRHPNHWKECRKRPIFCQLGHVHPAPISFLRQMMMRRNH